MRKKNFSENLNYIWLNIHILLALLARKNTCVLPYHEVTAEVVGDPQCRVTDISARDYPKKSHEITPSGQPASAWLAFEQVVMNSHIWLRNPYTLYTFCCGRRDQSAGCATEHMGLQDASLGCSQPPTGFCVVGTSLWRPVWKCWDQDYMRAKICLKKARTNYPGASNAGVKGKVSKQLTLATAWGSALSCQSTVLW